MFNTGSHSERREDVRLASGKRVEVVVMDDNEQPIELFEATVLNVSAGGLAMVADQCVNPGERLHVVVLEDVDGPDRQHPIHLQVLACERRPSGRRGIRCKLTAGLMPAELIYGWSWSRAA